MLASLLAFLLGVGIVGFAFGSAIRTFMLPGTGPHLVSRVVFRSLQRLFEATRGLLPAGRPREVLAGLYAPVCLLAVYGATIGLAAVGFAALFWSLGDRSVVQALVDSGLSISTLGSPSFDQLRETILSVLEALIATTISALLIGYLPTIHSAFLTREKAISTLEAHLGETESGPAILVAFARASGAEHLPSLWGEWIPWFADIGESHGTLAGVLFLRSPRVGRSWVTTAGAVLDAAALAAASLDPAQARQADRCVRTGAAALGRVVDLLDQPPPAPGRVPVPAGAAVGRAAFDRALAQMTAAGYAVKADCATSWATFEALRASYEAPLLALCRLKLVSPGRWEAGGTAAT